MANELQLDYLPYLGLNDGERVAFGGAFVWGFDALAPTLVPDEQLRQKVHRLLAINVKSASRRVRQNDLVGMGVVSVGRADFRLLSEVERREVLALRTALFLCRLALNVLVSPTNLNAGMYLVTSENFILIEQHFTLENDSIAEVSGTIIRKQTLGLKLSDTQIPMPSYVNQPSQFKYDSKLLSELEALRTRSEPLYARVMRAAEVFLESYYNAPFVSLAARLLLQAAAFEILLDLPDEAGRKAFKDLVELHCGEPDEPKLRYRFEVRKSRKEEARSLKGIWADRFYTLRNHIIHGEPVANSDYMFLGQQHHLSIAPIFFTLLVKRLIDSERAACGERPVFAERVDCERWIDDSDASEIRRRSFVMQQDFGRLWLQAIT